MKLDADMMKQIKDDRLLEYLRRMYVLELDIAALRAVEDTEGLAKAQRALEGLKKAYEAVEAV